MMLDKSSFAHEPLVVASSLIGKVLRHFYQGRWLSAMIIETEAYYLNEKGSHSSLGLTEKRRAMFMPPGTIYMYYARGGDSLNISCEGDGNAVLLKSGIPYTEDCDPNMIRMMQQLNPIKNSARLRNKDKLCSGQTLLCRSLGLEVPHWNQKTFNQDTFHIEDVGYRPQQLVQTTRLGIPQGRDEHLPYRFIDANYLKYCTQNPVTKRNNKAGIDFIFLSNE